MKIFNIKLQTIIDIKTHKTDIISLHKIAQHFNTLIKQLVK